MSGTARPSLADVEPASSVTVGDLIRTSANLYPHYEVIAVADGRVWIRDVQRGTDPIVPIDRCRKIEVGGA